MKNHSKTRLDKARECLQKRKEECLPIAFPPCPPPCPPPVKCEERTMVCNNTCGNFLFQDSITSLKIWEKEISKEVTITIVVFNSAYSSSSIEVVIGKEIGNPITFLVPLGGSLSRTVENANFVKITGENGKRVDGKFCLDIC
ncbi:hypothetical protein P4J20_32345, partial [Bacillus cereus]|nr:hypothetical protein [Bacillus cereus]